jgi:hypothetical protein
LASYGFDLRASTKQVNIVGTDYAVRTYGDAIVRLVQSGSPDTALRFHSWRYDGVDEQIGRGAADLGLYGGYVPDDLDAEQLVSEELTCDV